MTAELRGELIAIVKRWGEEVVAMETERDKWPHNHVNRRIYSGMINQLSANLSDVIDVVKRHNGDGA